MKEEGAIHKNQLPSDAVFVMDGGALLHKDKTFDELYQVYITYLRQHYKSCLVVFDGYEAPSTKSDEHLRRAGASKTCPGVDIVNCNKVPFSQDRFLSNTKK